MIQNSWSEQQTWKKTMAMGAVVANGLIVGYSRMFLGVHSINQVIYGLLLGAWLALTFNYCVKDSFL